MVVTLGQQYNIEEKPTVILYTYINRHAGTQEKQRKTQKQNITLIAMQGHQKNSEKHTKKKKKWYIVTIYCYIGCEDEVTTLKREQRGP